MTTDSAVLERVRLLMAVEFRVTCPDCGTLVGSEHHFNCDVARCGRCRMQALSCGCVEPEPTIWIGLWPGTMTAIVRGWYARMEPGKGWQPCSIFHPEATPDLNRVTLYQQAGTDTLYPEGDR